MNAPGDLLHLHHLEVEAEVLTPLVLEEYAGAAVRGALFRALWGRFCTNKAAPACAVCPLVATCPVATLVAPLREEGPRGQDVPRPYVVTPPPGGRYAPGQRLTLGLTLFGQAAGLFPYIVMALQTLAEEGLGRRLGDQGGRRGRLAVRTIAAVHPLTGERRDLYTVGHPRIAQPALPVTAADVAARARSLPTDRLRLEFLTPLRLTEGGALVHRLALRPLVQRLLERLDAVRREYGDGQVTPLAERQALLARAAAAMVVADQTRWVEVRSYSARQQRLTPISGLVGVATVGGDLAELRTVLVWGELVRVGKNAVKGAGWYRIVGGRESHDHGAAASLSASAE